MDEVVFSSLIAFNGKLTSQCGNLSTHHYHITYYPCFDTQLPYLSTGSPSSLNEPHKEHNMASSYKGLSVIFYKISMKVVKSENVQ